MLEDEQHEIIIKLLQQIWQHLDAAETNLREVSHYITEDVEYKKLIVNMRIAKRRMEEAIFTSAISPLGEADG